MEGAEISGLKLRFGWSARFYPSVVGVVVACVGAGRGIVTGRVGVGIGASWDAPCWATGVGEG